MASLSGSGVFVHVDGVVQGVGFRPFVFALAARWKLHGWVCNTSAGVDIELDGEKQILEAFVKALTEEAPPLAQIDQVHIVWQTPKGFERFEIVHSQAIPDAFQPISPDVNVCEDCLHELFDKSDRRYRYPFINCTNCGPRFTIIKDVPYDRPNTTMADFPLCEDCEAEYENPLNRRFHAQPVACDVCGPEIWLEEHGVVVAQRDEAMQQTRTLLKEGKIVAIKGLGGFHLACDATNETAVKNLRKRKHRLHKPFAIMSFNITNVKKICAVSGQEEALLVSCERPIVLLDQKKEHLIAPSVAPRQQTMGVMLPYTPLHYLLMAPDDDFSLALVMTSGNLSEEPIATLDDDARQRLGKIADVFLMHNRPIQTRCDDSVMRVFERTQPKKKEQVIYPIRRGRGYAPYPVGLPWQASSVLAVGGELKNTFCLTKENYAFMSHHIGDLENAETLAAFEESVRHYESLFRIQPEAIVCDMHPGYLSTTYAERRAKDEGLPLLKVQHHHAHVAAVMAENGLDSDAKVIGVSFDGTGFGTDGTIWGGEFLIADYSGFERAFHLETVPMVGADLAVRQPWRLAHAWMKKFSISERDSLAPYSFLKSEKNGEMLFQAVDHQLSNGLNSVETSSVGRLFDAVSSLIGVCQTVHYEGQAAIELENLIDYHGVYDIGYGFELFDGQIGLRSFFEGILSDLKNDVEKAEISAKFHNSLAEMVLQVCLQLREKTTLNQVALSGGVWQNRSLLRYTLDRLEKEKFDVLLHRKVPTNDGGIALGQAVIVQHKLQK